MSRRSGLCERQVVLVGIFAVTACLLAEYDDCVEYDKATDCKVFQSEVPCLGSCSRYFITSSGPALENQEQSLGCYRLGGATVGNTLVWYQNMNRKYLSPDAISTILRKHWLIGDSINAFNGGIKNEKYDYVNCPYDNWEGWEVDTGLGNFQEDVTMITKCHTGDEGAQTNTPPIPQPTESSTGPPQRCHRDGPNGLGHCQEEFLCCQYSTTSQQWSERNCHCINDMVYDEVSTTTTTTIPPCPKPSVFSAGVRGLFLH